MDKELGRYAFLAGLVLSVVLGLIEIAAGVAWLVAVLGIAVALLNIQAKETMKLLLWTIGVGFVGVGAIAANFAGIPAVGPVLATTITNIGIFFMTIDLSRVFAEDRLRHIQPLSEPFRGIQSHVFFC